MSAALRELLDTHAPADATEAGDIARLRRLLAEPVDPWARRQPLHCTGSALVLHPPTRRVLLRWHENLGRFLHVGGHGDPGEVDPYAVALREAREETGLVDLRPFPGVVPALVQVAIVPVPARPQEPEAHEHADFRYLLATDRPAEAVPEKASAVLRWCTVPEALAEIGGDRLADCVRRAAALFDPAR